MGILRIYIKSFSGLSKEAWMLALVMLINRSGAMVLPFLGVYMTDHLHFSLKSSGIVLSFFGIGSVIGSWLGGCITDRIGPAKVQISSLLLSIPLFCLLPLFKTVEGLAGIMLVQSIISESFRPANSVAVTMYARPENLTRAFSLNRMAVNLGFSIGPALGGLLAAISYNFLFFVNAGGALCAALTYIFFFSNRKARQAAKTRQAKAQGRMKGPSAYRDMPFIFYCLFCALFSICFFQFFSTLPLFYQKEAGLDARMIGYILGYSGIIIVFMEMLLVNLAEKYLSPATTLLLGALCCAVSYALLAIDSNLAILFVSMTILCVGEILVLPFMSAITAWRSGADNKGAYMGLNGMSVAIAFIITPYLGTQIASDFGFNSLWVGSAIILGLVAFAFYAMVNKMAETQHSGS